MATLPRIAARRRNTNRFGASFDDRTINAVWSRATIMPGVDPNIRRKDACGAWIQRSLYGNTVELGMGWEIDHVIPVSRNGTDDLPNLQPLQWQNNREKSDGFPLVPAQYTAVFAKS